MVGYLLHEQEMPSNNKGNSGIIMRQLTKTNTQTKKPKKNILEDFTGKFAFKSLFPIKS